MFKRVIWLGVGAAAGSVSTVWAQRKVKHQVGKVAQMATPAHVSEVAKARIGGVRHTVEAAVAEGRSARRASEVEMRARVERRIARPESAVGHP